MDKETLKRAKKILRNQYGEAFAKKASDPFCAHIAGTRAEFRSRAVGLENFDFMLSEISQPGMIIEFKASPAQQKKTKKKSDPSVTKKINKLLESIGVEGNLSFNLQQLLRQARVKTYRENIINDIHPVNAFLERKIEREFAHSTRSLARQPYLTRLCWLNQTVQTIAEPKSLAEVASDPKITRFDLPRKLEAEINGTGTLVFAPQYRKKFSRTGKDIIIAVIDSEVALNLMPFGSRVTHRRNYTKEPWGNPDKHGTAVAGIIGSADAKFSGMAPGISIYNYKVLATDGSLNGDDFDGSLAIERAVEDGCTIANCSWHAGPAGDGTGREARACDAAWDLGMTIVKSAGNNGLSGSGTLTSPADARGIIVVGATDRDGKKVAPYSSRGPLPSGEHRPHLVAPGGLSGNGIFSISTGGDFKEVKPGTSYAAPHVTGLIALLLENDPSLTPDELRDLVLKLCTKLGGGGGIDTQGAGLISLASLV